MHSVTLFFATIGEEADGEKLDCQNRDDQFTIVTILEPKPMGNRANVC